MMTVLLSSNCSDSLLCSGPTLLVGGFLEVGLNDRGSGLEGSALGKKVVPEGRQMMECFQFLVTPGLAILCHEV
jgi:hypothetical protein